MKKAILFAILFASGCMTMPTTVSITCPMGEPGTAPTVNIQNMQNKPVQVDPKLTTRDVTLPIK